MCGIVGWIDWESNLVQQKPLLEKMTSRLTARGPDASGYWISQTAALGHRRLIVVDPEGGRQPMIRTVGDRKYVLAYNGELYNTDEIRQELIERGHCFKSYSDTEVVLVSFIEWGSACVERFNGIYAFGIWEESGQELFLARDRLGVKPLFYTRQGMSFIFGSELKVLLAHPKVLSKIDRNGLAEIFGIGPARTPGQGVFKNVAELRPGCWLIFNHTGVRINRYWQLRSELHLDDLTTTALKVRELLRDSIKRQLVSDVPICTFLSGGLDSSIISTVAAEAYRDSGRGPLRTYSIDYTENEKYFKASDYQPNSDHPWADRMAKHLATDHHWIYLDTPELLDSLDEALRARDLPGMADIDSSLYLFCKEIKREATVALSGECADEVFGGYPWFHRPETVDAQTFPWSLSLETRNRIITPELTKILKLEEYVRERYLEALAEVPRLPGEDPVEARRRELFYLNINWFMTLLLDRKDRMSMASGLEVRVPFCDHRLVEYVWNIPWKMKVCDQREKGILRRAVREMLPEDIVYRKKSPYPKTHNPEYLRLVKQKLLSVIEDNSSPIRDLLNPTAIRELTRQKSDSAIRPWFGQLMGEAQLYAYLLQINTWLKEYKVIITID